MTKQLSKQAVAAACATKGIKPDQVTDARLSEGDIFLQTVIGEIRVEISALPASTPVVIEAQPETLHIAGVPSNTLAALVKAGYTTLAKVYNASDEDLLAVDGVGQAMLKRIRDQLEIPF